MGQPLSTAPRGCGQGGERVDSALVKIVVTQEGGMPSVRFHSVDRSMLDQQLSQLRRAALLAVEEQQLAGGRNPKGDVLGTDERAAAREVLYRGPSLAKRPWAPRR